MVTSTPPRLESNLVAILIGQSVFDAKLSLQVIGTMNGDLGFLGFCRKRRLDDFWVRPPFR
jgi:hypothetical protein